MHAIQIRSAVKKDLPIILEIFNHAIANTTAIYNYDPYTETYINEWFELKQKAKEPIGVATLNNVVTGFVTYGTFRSRPAYKYVKEHSIYVHPNYRKKGIAKLLMTHIIELAALNNVHTLIGGIDAENKVSIRFHQDFGFNKAGYLKEVGYKFGRWLDLVFMQKILETPLKPNEVNP